MRYSRIFLLLFAGIVLSVPMHAQTVIFQDTFSTAGTVQPGGTNNNWYALTAHAVNFGVSCSGADYPTCAQINVQAGDNGNNLLMSCTENSFAGCHGTGVTLPSDYYTYYKMQMGSGADLGGGPGKFTYNKSPNDVTMVCIYVYEQQSTNPLVVQFHPYCDVPDDSPGYYSPNFTVGTSWHTLEQHYVAGQLYDTRFDGQEIVSFPSGTGGGTMLNELSTDFEPGLYSNNSVASSFAILLNDVQICTGNWCSAGSVAKSTAAAPSSSPTASFSPSSLDFGSYAVGTDAPAQTITLTNTGTANLTWTGGPSLTGETADFAQTSTTCTSVLAPNASCNIVARYQPQAAGNESASVTMTGANTGTGTLSVALSGSGFTPTPTTPSTPTSSTTTPTLSVSNVAATTSTSTVTTTTGTTSTETSTVTATISNSTGIKTGYTFWGNGNVLKTGTCTTYPCNISWTGLASKIKASKVLAFDDSLGNTASVK